MLQIIFRIPLLNMPIYGYGLMLVLAFLACVRISKFMARKIKLDPEVFVNATLIALVTGVIGSRLSHVLENWPEYSNPERSFIENFLDAVNIRSGGLTFYGGLILATPCCLFYMKKKKLPLLKTLDIVAVCIMVGLGIGRIGCYLNGCCYGELIKPSFGASIMEFPYYSNPYIEQFRQGLIQPPEELLNHPSAGRVTLKNLDQVRAEHLTALADQQKALPVQPTQLYSFATAIMLAFLLYAYWTIPHLDGRGFALMLMLEGPARFLLEMIRVEPPVIYGHYAGFDLNMSLSMVLGLIVFVTGVGLWVFLGWRNSLENRRIFAPAH